MVNAQKKQFITLQDNSYFLNKQKIQSSVQMIMGTIILWMGRVNGQGWSNQWVFGNQKKIKEKLIKIFLNSHKDSKNRINQDIINMQTNMHRMFRQMKEMDRWCSLLSSVISPSFKLGNDFLYSILSCNMIQLPDVRKDEL